MRFAYPAIYSGQEVTDIELWFENGKVVKEKASKGQELLITTEENSSHPGGTYLLDPRTLRKVRPDQETTRG